MVALLVFRITVFSYSSFRIWNNDEMYVSLQFTFFALQPVDLDVAIRKVSCEISSYSLQIFNFATQLAYCYCGLRR